jgi:hypothetical protein
MKLIKNNSLVATTLLSVVLAMPAFAANTVKMAEQVGTFNMPAGDYRNPVVKRTAISTGLATPDSSAEAKAEAGAASGAVITPSVKGGVTPRFASAGCATNIATGFAPSDIHGAVGSTVLVVVTNVDIGIYNKSTCAIISRVPLKTFFAGFGDIANQTLFDPRVIYDRAVGRFFVTVESRDNRAGNTDQYQYFAVSTTSAAAAFHRYRIGLSIGASFFCKRAANSFWDYPSVGKTANRWFITANDFPAAGGASGAVLVLDKTPSLSGAGVGFTCFNNRAFNISPPIVLDGLTSQSVFLAPNTANLTRYNHAAGATVGADTLTVATAYDIPDWAVPPDAVQPNGQELDSLDGRFQSSSIQSRDRIWNIHTVAFGTRPLIRWYRLQRSVSSVLSTVTFQSTGTSHLFNPSFVTSSGLDGASAFINASRTEPAATCVAASCRAAMITFSGPNSVSSDWTQSLAGTSSNNFATAGATSCNASSRGSCRWGDYSSINVDPNDANRAWGFNQLINGPSQFNWFTSGREEVYVPPQFAPDN